VSLLGENTLVSINSRQALSLCVGRSAVSLRTHLNPSPPSLNREVSVASVERVLFENGALFGAFEFGDDVAHDA
jgi:hypothetical protein